jgi:serine/threonine-protein kinase
MSPEQCSQSPDIDARSDIYSLGVILYEMLVGHVPFAGGSPTEIMLKHLQQPAPSVLDERSDVPKAVGRVVARAMEKRPENRYKTVGELVEDFTIAAGMEPASVYSSGPNRPVEPPTPQQLSDNADEETLVRRRVTRPMEPIPPPAAAPFARGMSGQMPPPNASFNPWKVLVPSMIGLLVIFGVIYAFTRNSQPTNATTSGSTLAADPNSSPVEPAKPPTGESEAGIPAGGTTIQSANTNTSVSPEVSESPKDIGGVNLNANDNANENSNTRKATLPLPSPTRQVDVEPPLPSPTATKPPQAKPTLPPPNASPPELR